MRVIRNMPRVTGRHVLETLALALLWVPGAFIAAHYELAGFLTIVGLEVVVLISMGIPGGALHQLLSGQTREEWKRSGERLKWTTQRR